MRVKEFLDQAVALDPEFAAAHCLLGLYYTMFASLGMKPTREVIPLARAAVHEALRIEPSLSEAHALRGVWAGGYDNYDWREAEQHWRVAMSGELVSCHVHFWYGHHYLLPLGRFHDALAEMKKGLEGDPINLLYRHHLAVGLRNVGRLDEAEAELRRVLEALGDSGDPARDRTDACVRLATMMGALLLARASHGDPLSDEIAAAARARLTTDNASRGPERGAKTRRTKAKGGAQ